LKELLLLGKPSLSASICDLLFQKVIDKIFVNGFSQNDDAEALWALIIIGKIVDILDNDIISNGIYDLLFGNRDFSSLETSNGSRFCLKWIGFFRQDDGMRFIFPFSYLLHSANMRGVFLKFVGSENIKQHLEIFLQKAFSCDYTPTLLLQISFKMSSTLRKYLQDLSILSVILNL
jgi:hypothetical protein